MVIGILSAGVLLGIVIGIMVKYIIDGIFGRDTKATMELRSENARLKERLKELECKG